jgi:hypothetical protein
MTVPAPPVRRFTVDDANRTLPLVRMIVQDIVELYNDLDRRRDRLVALRARGSGKSRGADDPYESEVRQMELELEADVERLGDFIAELQKLGAELKDPAAGLVDFPAVIDGQEAYLCWRLGEPAVGHWHDLKAGVAGRRALNLEPAVSTTEPTDGRHHSN